MKKFILLLVFFVSLLLSGCMIQENISKISNNLWWSKIKSYFSKTVKETVWNWQNSETWNTVKWYASQYYDEELSWYVNTAKIQLSWAVNELKIQYNSWVDSVSETISKDVTDAIIKQMNNLKVK